MHPRQRASPCPRNTRELNSKRPKQWGFICQSLGPGERGTVSRQEDLSLQARRQDLTPEQSVREFRLYQEEVVRFLGETEGRRKAGAGIRGFWISTR